jgi:dTDP-4-amino-4,6-dideoxygalactose transaminase
MVSSSTEAPSSFRIPLVDLTTTSREIQPALDAVWAELSSSSAFIGGEYVERFEEEWARYCGTRHAVGLANGTDALELSLRALEIGPGYEVIIPTNTFVATVEAVVLAGAIPRLVDVDDDTLLLTPETVRAALSERSAAVIPVHLYGAMPDMDGLKELCRDRGLVLIEDAAQAHGASWSGRRAGSIGHVGSFSFYPAKNLGGFGDAGAIVTDDGGLADRVRQLGNHGRPRGAPHVHSMIARNSRLDALQAGVLSEKLRRLDQWNSRRRALMEVYRSHLPSNGVRMVGVHPRCEPVYHQNVVRVRHREDARSVLEQLGIETGVHYPIPCHLQEPYRQYVSEPLPVSERAAREVLSLPLFPHMTMGHVDRVVAGLRHALEAIDGTDH